MLLEDEDELLLEEDDELLLEEDEDESLLEDEEESLLEDEDELLLEEDEELASIETLNVSIIGEGFATSNTFTSKKFGSINDAGEAIANVITLSVANLAAVRSMELPELTLLKELGKANLKEEPKEFAIVCVVIAY